MIGVFEEHEFIGEEVGHKGVDEYVFRDEL